MWKRNLPPLELCSETIMVAVRAVNLVAMVAEAVDTGEHRSENVALRRLVAVYRHLSSLAVQDAGLDAITDLIAGQLDTTVAVVDDTMEVRAAATPGARSGDPADAVRERVVHPRLPQVLTIAGRARRALRLPDVDGAAPLIVAPVLVGHEVPAYVMTVDDGDGETGTGEDLRLLVTEHAATICGVILGRDRVVAAAATRVRYDLVEGLLSGKGGDAEDVLRWARHLGYDPECEHRVVSVVFSQRAASRELAQRVLAAVERSLTAAAPEAIIALRGDEVAVVLPDGGATPRAHRVTQACLDRVRDLFGDVALTAGVGGLCRAPTEIARSYDDARRAVEVTRRMGRAGTAVAFDDLGIHRLLLQVAEPAQLRAFADEVFGRLRARARGNAAEYLATLGCYFRANNSPQRASQILHVHPNTVTYRVRRVEELTELDFGNYRDRLMAQVALEILDAVGEQR
jgi:hypothetical protein